MKQFDDIYFINYDTTRKRHITERPLCKNTI